MKACEAAVPPASEAVWLTAPARASSERPTLRATKGFFSARALAAIASKARRSPIPSIWRPMAVTRGSSITAMAISASPVCAWFPAAMQYATAKARVCMVMLIRMFEDWVRIATPESVRSPPCWSGQSSAPSK